MTQVGDPTDFNWVIGSIQNDLGIIHVETMLVQCDVLQERGFTRDHQETLQAPDCHAGGFALAFSREFDVLTKCKKFVFELGVVLGQSKESRICVRALIRFIASNCQEVIH